jgi:two-component system nitrogen regulation sensor histidine kinase NtrY
VRFDRSCGAGFSELGRALNEAIGQFRSGQERLAAELRYLDALLDDMPVAVLTADAQGRVTLANKAARRLFKGHAGTKVDDFAAYGATLSRRLAGVGGGGSHDTLILNLDGRSQRVLVSDAALLRLGEHGRVLILQPIQGTLDAVEMAAQTDLVRVLTHEILNSLTPVRSLAATAADLLSEPDLAGDARIEDARAAVATLSRRAQGLGRFIEAYRAVERTPEMHRQWFAARAWSEEIVSLFTAETPGVPLALELEPADLALDADGDLLAQVLINLLRNAAQALAGRTAPRVLLRLREAARSTVIEVQDNGPGVPAALKGDIFLPFFTTRAAGTGVGLNLARQIVVAHGGTIDVLDAPGGGALFRIVI